MNYHAYIRSDEWRAVKARYRASKLSQRCYICDDSRVELHHKSYKRLGKERLTDLLPLCRTHHQAVHDLLKEAKAQGSNPSKWNHWTAAKRLKQGRRPGPGARRKW